jgi:rfaE bifunctional protein kinase chain/domain
VDALSRRDGDHAEPHGVPGGRRTLERRRRNGEEGAGAARELDLDAILVTRSEEGMSLYTAAGAEDIPAVAREVYDVSGAGDTVIATLGVLLAAGADLAAAVRIANEAAGVVVGKLGTAVATPDELA